MEAGGPIMKGRIAELNTALFTADQLAQLVNIPVIPAGKVLPMNIYMNMPLFYWIKDK
jgi:hypothetical protein